ncbi:UNVERIFIED_CONTAM: hypothetical protein FKN15_049228 [Acipenser sinensis]
MYFKFEISNPAVFIQSTVDNADRLSRHIPLSIHKLGLLPGIPFVKQSKGHGKHIKLDGKGNAVPVYLRYEGAIKNLKLKKIEIVDKIKDIWEEKVPSDQLVTTIDPTVERYICLAFQTEKEDLEQAAPVDVNSTMQRLLAADVKRTGPGPKED